MQSETDLSIAVETENSWSRRLSITVPAARVSATRARVSAQFAQRAGNLPGFRKGKVPVRLVEQRFGASIDEETVDRLVQEAYREALMAEEITPVSQGKVDDVRYERNAELTFAVAVEVKPEFELERTSGFTVSRPAVETGDAEIDAVLDRLRDERTEWEDIEVGVRPDYGDEVAIDITPLSVEGADQEEPRTYRIVIGEDQAIPDVEAAILTLGAGETGEFDVRFPDDFPEEERRGQAQRLRIAVQTARRKVLPELDDAFAHAVSGLDTVVALRERIGTDLAQEAEQRADAEVRRHLVDQVIEANPFEVPLSMVENYLDYMLDGPPESRQRRRDRSPEQQERYLAIREELRPQAEWGIKRTLVIERLAEIEGLRATQDEIDARVEEIARQHERSPGEVWIELEKNGQLEEMERDITETKVFETLRSRNTVA